MADEKEKKYKGKKEDLMRKKKKETSGERNKIFWSLGGRGGF